MKKIKWGVIGCAGIADKRTLPGMMLSENSECIAVMDLTMEKAEAIREKYGVKYAFDSVEALLELEEIDAVYIATPLFCHKEQVMKAADAGKHVLVEKPMGLSTAENIEMTEYCKAKGVMLGVAFMMRFHGAHQKIKELVESGVIGEIVSANAKFNTYSPVVKDKWRQTKAMGGGGAMMDMGIHCIDLLQYITGLNAVEVTAFCSSQIFHYPDTEDAANAVLRMNSGALFTVEANFNIPYTAGGSKFEIYGTEGSVVSDQTLGQEEIGSITLIRSVNGERISETIPYVSGNMYTKEVSAFSDAITSDMDVPVSADAGIFAQRIVEAVYESDEKGIKIRL